MKTFSVAVAVAVVLTIICLQENSAIQLSEEQDTVEVVFDNSPLPGEKKMPEDSWKMPYQRMQMQRRRCRFCCGCCPRMRGCGVCCRF